MFVLLYPAKCINMYKVLAKKGAGRDGRVRASVGSTGGVGAARPRSSGWLVAEGPLILPVSGFVNRQIELRVVSITSNLSDETF